MIDKLLRHPEYIHVLINPLPIYGLALALIGLTIALFTRTRAAQVTTLVLVLVSAASAWPVYEMGQQGYDRVLAMSDDAGRAWLDEHQRRGEQLIYFFYALAVVALVALIAPWRWPKSSIWLCAITLLLGVVVLGMSGYIAYAGGKIRHREFRNEPPPASATQDRQS